MTMKPTSKTKHPRKKIVRAARVTRAITPINAFPTFADITVAKTLEAKLRSQHAVLEKHVAKQSNNQKKVPRSRKL